MRVNPNYTADMVNLMDQAQQNENNAPRSSVLDAASTSLPTIPQPKPRWSPKTPNPPRRSIHRKLRFAHRRSQHRQQHLEFRRHPSPARRQSRRRGCQQHDESDRPELHRRRKSPASRARCSRSPIPPMRDSTCSPAPPPDRPYVPDATINPNRLRRKHEQNKVQIGTGFRRRQSARQQHLFSTRRNVFDALQSLVTALQSGDTTRSPAPKPRSATLSTR